MKADGGCWMAVLTLAGWLLAPRVEADCTKQSACSCQHPDGLIDLSPLDGNGGARFPDQPTQPAGSYVYSWNPCTPFTELNTCQSVSGCQVSTDYSQAFAIGTQDSAEFVTDTSTGDLTLQYSAPSGDGGVRKLAVTLICDPTADPGTLITVGETTTANYVMSLSSIHCCPKSGPQPGGNSAGSISIGSILVIAFFGVVVVYAATGLAIQKFARKATGREVIPNYNMWSAVAGLVKDGFVLTFTCGRRGGYDKV